MYTNYFVVSRRNFMEFGERLKELRKMKGLTQRELADILGINEVSYQRYEYGLSYPTFKKLIIIADYFMVSIDYLVGRSNNPIIC